ncbi:mitochondrial protein ymf11 [Pyrus ussuriensis x Pyrus communis]|uniref:Mitochondrial protein ymf11 n=1 Tax=Pyrus ussuriensis x Pyrus communis TaxID=2448454 RepID=A0A5N5GWZ8_9ROSA|nr:mitochondrial protein ymf11 [Pyrus ussuriensis x Pyrus communis]
MAYQRSCAHVTGTFPPRSAIHSHVLHDLLSLRNAVVRGSFSWNKKTQQYIRSPNDKPSKEMVPKRKLQAMLEADEPCFQDRVVQEVLLMILEPVFEARFSPKSHAFRPGRNAHTVIRTIRSNFAGYLWVLKGDISEIFDNVDRNCVMGCLEQAVRDRKILGLIQSPEWRKNRKKKKTILNDKEPKPDPYWLRAFFNFAPEEAAKVSSYGHCEILSPLLANVCLNELDQVIEDKIVEFFRPYSLDSIWKTLINDGCHNPSWPEFVLSCGNEKTRKMDWPREDAMDIRKQIIEFCERRFGIRLDNSKVEIEHITRGIQFLDHIISRRVIHPTLRYTATGGNVVSQKGVATLLSVTASLQQRIRQFRRLEFVKGDKDPEPLPCTPMLYSGQAHTNSQMNKLLETMVDWYKYADNRKKVVGFCAYVICSSLAKLYAARYRLKSRAKVNGIVSCDLSRPLRESSNKSAPEYSDLLRVGLVDPIEGVRFSHMSLIPSCDYSPFPRNWVPAHEQLLRDYIRHEGPKFFYEISEILWDFKTLGVRNYKLREERETRKDCAS